MASFEYQVKRSNTGKYHLGVVGGNSANCNGRSGHFVAATKAHIDAAPTNAFCAKCFNNGKRSVYDLSERGLLKLLLLWQAPINGRFA